MELTARSKKGEGGRKIFAHIAEFTERGKFTGRRGEYDHRVYCVT